MPTPPGSVLPNRHAQAPPLPSLCVSPWPNWPRRRPHALRATHVPHHDALLPAPAARTRQGPSPCAAPSPPSRAYSPSLSLACHGLIPSWRPKLCDQGAGCVCDQQLGARSTSADQHGGHQQLAPAAPVFTARGGGQCRRPAASSSFFAGGALGSSKQEGESD
ncbi:hypothetical protein PVAP13_7KG075109 [Panicum virgatum]|uniref:Uncharacterized protein n=1 Tax=Panicum virgatum TaxID=38727 RepID=A0A8T0QJI3_PANVG|nr:hypothetical protein PVAP13_7KG075109 [Panicum virgatum]